MGYSILFILNFVIHLSFGEYLCRVKALFIGFTDVFEEILKSNTTCCILVK